MGDREATLLTIAAIVVTSLIASEVGRRTALPRVTLLLALGVVAGPSVLSVLPSTSDDWFPLVTNVSLAMVGFLLGEEFRSRNLERYGRQVLGLSLGVSLVTAVAVFVGAIVVTGDIALAMLLSAAASATDPAATREVAREVDAEGDLTHTLFGVVAIDDVWGIVLFSIALTTAGAIEGGDGLSPLLSGSWEIGGAILLGAALGFPLAKVTGRVEPGEPTLLEALGAVLLVAGLALWMDVSFLLASVVLGAVVANFATHHTRPFHEIEGIEAPFLALFFFLAGASLEFSELRAVVWLFGAYVVARSAGRVAGAWLFGRALSSPPAVQRWLGISLLPQAGVAIGMALLVQERFPDIAEEIIPVVIGSTVAFELAGPALTRIAFGRAGEAGQRS